MAIVNKRLGNISLIQKYWSQGNITHALSTMCMTKDQSTIMDVFTATFADGVSMVNLTLDHVVAILPLALNLIKAKFECHIQTGLKTIESIFKKFAEVI